MIDDLHFREYDPAWPARFERLATALAEHLPEGVSVEHVGSTAVPGLAAKDCIDILVVVSPGNLAVAQDALRAAGYEERPGAFADDPHRWFWRLVQDLERVAHAHLVLDGHPAAAEQRAVRDLLRRDPRWREAYQRVKASMAAADAHDRPAYLAGKADFVRHMTEAALGQHKV